MLLERPVAPTGRPRPEEVLRTCFGHPSFRPGQREVIEAVVAGRDTVAVMPTGAGKSVTFQVPARLGLAPVLVVSPLVALMRDQVDGCRRRGLRATWIEAGLAQTERAARIGGVRDGSVELLYVSPEALPGIAASLAAPVGLLAVDEAHCISQWGHDFRPPYRRIGEARALLGDPPTLAVTATATPDVVADIASSLGLRAPFVWRGSFLRDNLRLAALRKDSLTDTGAIVRSALESSRGPAIVYCLSRRGSAALASKLRSWGVAAAPYHAGMDGTVRAEVQEAFASGEVRAVVATIAFGMGIDKADVRLVVHTELPGSLEAYAQEIGRAGRDGEVSDCLLLYAWSDVDRRLALARDLPAERRAQVRRMLREAYVFAAGRGCRHRRLCAHFGEQAGACGGSCDRCGGPRAREMVGGRSVGPRW